MTSTISGLLVKYEGGMIYLGGGPREGFLSIVGCKEESQAREIGQAILNNRATPSTSTLYSSLPLGEGGPTDYGFDVGSYLSGELVAGVTMTFTDDGKATVIPELSSKQELEEERINRMLARIGNGSKDDGSGPAVASNPDQRGREYKVPVFGVDGLLSDAEGIPSPPFLPEVPIIITQWWGGLTVAGTGNTQITFYVNDESAGIITINAGKRQFARNASTTLALPTDRLHFVVTTAGAAASGLALSTRASIA